MKVKVLLFVLLVSGMFYAKAQLPGSTCDNPLFVDPVNAPLVNFAINSENYGNDYASSMVTPSSNYINGNDVVFQFTLAAKSYVNASISGVWTGLVFVATCPSTTSPATRIANGGGGTGATIATFILDAGTYFMIAGTYPPPQFTDMIINFSATPVPLDASLVVVPAELFVGWATPGMYAETKTLTLKNEGIADLLIQEGGFAFSGTNPADYSVSLSAGNTYPLTIPFGQSKVINVSFNPAVVGNSSAMLEITYNNPLSPVKTVPVSGLGYSALGDFAQNFDGITPVPTGWLPDGWAKIVQSTSTSAYVDVRTLVPMSPPNQLTFASSTDLNAKLFLVSPTATNLSHSRVYFTARMGSSTHTGKLQLGYMTSRTDPATFVSVATVNITGSWALYSVDLSSYAITYPTVAYIGIRYLPEVSSRIAVVDDIIYSLVPTQPIFNVNQTAFNFGNTTWMYESSTQLMQIYNSGAGNLTINEDGFQMTGDDPSYFSVEFPAGQTFPIMLAFGQYINLTLRFNPTEGRAYNAVLNITDNITKAVHPITLSGTGYDAMIEPGFLFDFTVTFPPKDWRKFIGLFGTETPAITTQTSWHHRKFANDPSLTANNSACINIAGTTKKHWLMSPPINLGDGSVNYQLEFDLAMTAKNTTTPANLGTEQKFQVVISTDGGLTWSTENVLRTWNSATPISNTGERIFIDLTGYSGRVMFGFYGESTITGGDVDLFFRNVEVNEYIPLVQLPLAEDFESAVFPSEYWTIYDMDGLGTEWVATAANNHTVGGQQSAVHNKGAEGQVQDGWLVTPLMQIPSQGPIILEFWSYNADPQNYGKNSVLVSTGSGNPSDGDFMEVWTTNTVSSSWVKSTLDLTDYINQTIYVAFRYEGTFAHSWYLDDIQLFVDTSPVIAVSPTSISKAQVQNVTSTASVRITNSGIDDLTFNVDVDYLGGAEGWLNSNPSSGSIQGGGFFQDIVVSCNSAGLTPGEYSAEVLINNNDPDNPQVVVSVSLSVSEPTIVQVTKMSGTYDFPIVISENGDYVAIVAFGGSSNYLWSKTNGLTAITGTGISVNGMSDEGIIAGAYKDPNLLYNGTPVQVAGTWDPETQEWTFLGMNPDAPAFFSTSYQTGYGISGDGQIFVGMQYITAASYKAFSWNAVTGYNTIGLNYAYGNRPNCINRSGNLIYGWAQTASISRSPAIWYGGNMLLLDPTKSGEAFGASPSGNFVTGTLGGSGFLWSQDRGLITFSNTLNTATMSPTTVLNDGTIFGFTGSVPTTQRRAFARLTDGTMMTFNDYANLRGLPDAAQWIFYSINDATPDGTKFIGAGVNPQGETMSFIIDFEVEIPVISVDPSEITETIGSGQTLQSTLNIENTGTSDLTWDAYILPPTGRKNNPTGSAPAGPETHKGNLDLGTVENKLQQEPELQDTRGVYVLNYDGPNSNSVGLVSGGTFYVAARFPSSLVAMLAGSSIHSVDVYIGPAPVSATLMIWGQGTTTTPGDILYQRLFNAVEDSWNTVLLNNPQLLSGDDIWVGLKIQNDPGVYPAGCDGGPSNMEGNWISNDGIVWEHISQYGIAGNWNIRASVAIPDLGWISIGQNSGTVVPGSMDVVNVNFDATGLQNDVYTCQILIESNDPEFPMTFIPVELEVTNCQQFSFAAGWNSISSFVTPETPAVETLFAPLSDNLTILRNLTSVYWPSAGVNTIGDFDNQSGYALRLSEDAGFQICGDELASTQLELAPGWTYLPVLSPCDVSATDLFGLHHSDFVIVQDLIGTGVYWPAMGVYSLTELVPGKAYKMKVQNPFTLSFPGCGKSGFSPAAKLINTSTTPWGEMTMTPSSEVVSFMAGSLEAFEPGDAIGAFGKDGQVFGIMEITNSRLNQAITLFGGEEGQIDNFGFAEGEDVTYKLYRKSTGEFFDLSVEYDQNQNNPTGNYYTGSLAAILKVSLAETGIGMLDVNTIQMFPNPANDELNLVVAGLTGQKVIVTITDVEGRVVYEENITGNTTLDISIIMSGVYILNLKSGSFNIIRKLVIQR